MSKKLYRVIENFGRADAASNLRCFRDQGRQAPARLTYTSNWVSDKLDRCYQRMGSRRSQPTRSMTNCSDLVDFEVRPVNSSK
jgi:hypothetical protein